MRIAFWVIERSFVQNSGVKSIPEYMDKLGNWCECIHHAYAYPTREEAQWFLTNYRGLSGGYRINYTVAEHILCDYQS